MLNQKKKNITLKDIAVETGFSVTAVSHALKDMADISPKAKERIKECAARLGYIGNSTASSLRTGKSRTIAMIVGDVANPHFAFLAKKVQLELNKSGYLVFVMSTNESLSTEMEAIRMACSRNIDGIILCPSQTSASTESVEFLKKSGVPFVLIGRYFRNVKTNFVAADDFQSGYLMGKHIISQGHTNIAYINTQQNNSSSEDRFAGFFSAIEKASSHITVTELLFDDYGSYFNTLLRPDGAPRFTAILAFNDIIAWDVMCRMEAQGKKIPEDISLAGFDNLHDYMPLPFHLTSIAPQKHIMSTEACRILLKHIDNPFLPEQQIKLNVILQDRQSILPLNKV